MSIPTCPDGRVTRLAIARFGRGMNCGEVGDAVGVTASQVSSWERGLSEPSAAQWKALALRLGWALGELRAEPLNERLAWPLAVAARNRTVRGVRPVAKKKSSR